MVTSPMTDFVVTCLLAVHNLFIRKYIQAYKEPLGLSGPYTRLQRATRFIRAIYQAYNKPLGLSGPYTRHTKSHYRFIRAIYQACKEPLGLSGPYTRHTKGHYTFITRRFKKKKKSNITHSKKTHRINS